MIIGFDLDGVVMQNPFSAGVFPWVRNHVRSAPRLSELEISAADELMNRAVNGIWMKRMEEGALVAAYDWDDILNEASRQLGGPAIPDVAGLVRKFCQEPGMIRLLPGAGEGLELLRENGFTIKALTNGYQPYQQPVLEALGIDHYFAELHTPELCGFAKPDAGMFEAAGSEVHVGDTLVHDIFGANQAGLTSIWLEPALPEELLALSPGERTQEPAFRDFLAERLEGNMYTRFHPEVSVETSQPDYAVTDVLEAARVLLDLRS
jgi:FMN phosphatase YigB (HAD superfamily)